jgi:hypothetical protein
MPIGILILIIHWLGFARFDLAPLGVATLPLARLGSAWIRSASAQLVGT